MFRLILIPVFLMFFSASAQENTQSGLQTINVYDSDYISISYNPACTEVCKIPVSELKSTDPLFPYDEYSPEDIKMILTKTDTLSTKEYIVVYSDLPSGDPHYIFYSTSKPAEMIFSVPGEKIFIPGDGYVYSRGHSNNTIEARKKYRITDSGLTEVKQPYYYAGLKSKALIDLKLYDSEDLKNETGIIRAGTEVQILLKKDETDLYLIIDSYGITGWIDAGMPGLMPTVIEDLFYSGD